MKENETITPRKVAEWMVEQLMEDDELVQQDAAHRVKELFGDEFVYCDEHGYLAISRKVLYQFKKLTGEAVVWVHVQTDWVAGYWRWREAIDKPGRRQFHY